MPFVTLTVGVLAILLMMAFYRNHALTFALTLADLALTLATIPLISSTLPRQVTVLLIFDEYAFFYLGQ